MITSHLLEWLLQKKKKKKIRNSKDEGIGEDVKKWNALYTVAGCVNCCNHYGKPMEVLQKVKHRNTLGLPGGSVVKDPPASAGETGFISGSGKSPGERNATHASILAWEIP